MKSQGSAKENDGFELVQNEVFDENNQVPDEIVERQPNLTGLGSFGVQIRAIYQLQ